MANAEQLVKLHGLWFRSLWKWAEKIPHEDAIVWLDANGSKAASLTYHDLRREALKIATCLSQVHCQQGDRAILCYPPSVSFVPAFIGCQICGLTAVPVYPPGSNDRDSDSIDRIVSMVKTTNPSVVLSSSLLRHFLESVLPNDATRCVRALQWIFTDELPDHVDDGTACELDSLNIIPETHAFIQFSSGSTGNPKGCVVTHRALLHNIHLNWRMCGAFHPGTKESLYDLPVESYAEFTEKYQEFLVSTWGHRLRFFSWLPVTHDMGLVGMLCVPLFFGCTAFLMSPVDFVSAPDLWLAGMSKFGCSFTAAPDFAYALAARKTSDDLVSELNFEKVMACVNGAEPIRPATIEAFLQKFSPAGFEPWMMCPAYGLAEHTVGVTGRSSEGRKPRNPRIIEVNQRKLAQGDTVEIIMPGAKSEGAMRAKLIVGCGEPHQGVIVKIVDPKLLHELPEWRIGEVWVSSHSAASGYFRCPVETASTFNLHLDTADGAVSGDRTFLRTGDLGFLGDGELFITGRLKDVIIIRGCNYYPQDIEEAVERCAAVRKGGVMAFAISTVNDGEGLGVAAEIQSKIFLNPFADLAFAINPCIVTTV